MRVLNYLNLTSLGVISLENLYQYQNLLRTYIPIYDRIHLYTNTYIGNTRTYIKGYNKNNNYNEICYKIYTRTKTVTYGKTYINTYNVVKILLKLT